MLITQLAYNQRRNMKKIFILALMVLVGISLIVSSNLRADEARTIPMKFGYAAAANTLIVGHGGTLYRILGRATSTQASYVVYDAATVAIATLTSPTSNILAEGGEATQYDTLEQIYFGDEGIEFNNGLVVVTTTAHVALHYR